MKKLSKTIVAACCCSVLFIACQDDDKKNTIIVENKSRIECERKTPVCNGKDAMRFYRAVPHISQAPDGQITVSEVWSSFVVCCEDFSRIMDSLTVWNQIFDSIPYAPYSIDKRDSIGNIHIYAGIWYPDELNSSKRYQFLSFGDSTMDWAMPTGKYFDAHKKELEEAHARCCLL